MKKVVCFACVMVLLLLSILTGCNTTASNTDLSANGQGSADASFLNNVLQSSKATNSKFDSANDAYTYLLKKIKNKTSSETLESYMCYFFKDIDGNNIEELCVKYQTEIAFYSFCDNQIIQVGYQDFYTGTLRIFSSDNPKYPGIFCFTAGAGFENYTYLTIKDGEIYRSKIWSGNYGFAESDDPDRIIEHTFDKEMINESKVLYANNKDIECLKFDSAT